MNLSITVALSGDDVTRRKAVEVEDAVTQTIQQLTDDAEMAVTYPAHRNGVMGFVITVGEQPAPARKPRATKSKPPPDPAVPVDNPDIPAPETT